MLGLIVIFLITIISFLIGNFFSYKKLLFSPGFGFFGGFILSIGYSFLYYKKWNLNLSIETVKVFVVGFLTFLCFMLITQQIVRQISLKKHVDLPFSLTSLYKQPIKVSFEKYKLILFCVLQVLLLILIVLDLKRLGMRSLSEAIFSFRETSLEEGISAIIPGYLRRIRRLCIASGYIWMYILIYDIVNGIKKNRFWLILNILLSIGNDILFGARTGLISILLAGMVQYYIIYESKDRWNRKIKTKTLMIGALVVLTVLWTFPTLGSLIGRSGTDDFSAYIAKYLSAEIKNLDLFVRNGRYGTDIYHNQTLAFLLNYLSGKFGLPDLTRTIYLNYNFYKSFNLGNVYTTFYPFYYDSGLLGVFFYTAVIAVLSEVCFLKATTYNNEKINKISIGILIYSYMFFTFAFSFFSNKFYEMIINEVFIESLIDWILIKIYLQIKIRK